MERIKTFIEESNKQVAEVMKDLYGINVSRAMKFLYDNVSRDVQVRFVNTYLNTNTLACFVNSSIVVREATSTEKTSRHSANFVITVVGSNGETHPLKFASKVSTVYYLMYLISRKQQTGKLYPIDLARNKSMFTGLYQATYDNVGYTHAQNQFQRLLYRVVNGNIRAGYKAQVECDIRHGLAQAFSTLHDSPIPYGMSRQSHLTVNPDRIIFEKETEALLFFEFD